MRSVPKKMIAVTTVPDTKMMPKICRSPRDHVRAPASDGHRIPQMNAAATQPENDNNAKKKGTSSARLRSSSPSGPSGGAPARRMTGRNQR